MTHHCIAVVFLCTMVSVACAEEGLLLHYAFSEGSGEIARDASGNGLDGQISGATFVPSPRGQALHFDGVDDCVTCPADDRLNLDGDLTIEVWLRAERIDERNRMIFGDAAGLTINRNYNLRLDQGNLRLEYADGESYGVFVHDAAPLDDHAWHHLALICEYPRYYLYLDGVRVALGGLELPITRTKGAQRMIGGWFAGHFQGDIDEVRLYGRALSQRQIVADAKGDQADAPPTLDLQAELLYTHKRVHASMVLDGLAEPPDTLELAVTPSGADRPREAVSVSPVATRPGAERWVAEADLPLKSLTPGTHTIAAVARAGGRELARAERPLEVPERPLWFESQAGITDELLPPFTPLEVRAGSGTVAVSPWGRAYQFGPGLPLEQIESAGEGLLAGPLRLQASVEGQAVAWPAPETRVLRRKPALVSLAQAARHADLPVSVEATVEQDGFAKLRVSLTPRRALRLDGLTFELPLGREHARYLYTWPKVHSGELREAYASTFQPIVWLGDEERGLQWTCESEEGWNPADPARAIEVIPSDEAAVLRLNLIGQPVELAEGERLTYTFGLQATPTKPMTRTAWDERIFRNPWYGYSLDVPDKEIEGQPALRYYAEKGGRAMLILRWWDAFAYTSPQSHGAELRRLVQACHAEGIKIVPYIGGFLLSENAPEGRCFMAEMQKTPATLYPIDRVPGLEKQMTRIVCQRSPWQEFLVDGIARLIDEYDVDGVYLDSTTIPWACSNGLHGCGYERPDGRRGPTYPVFEVRETLQRIYTVVKQRKPDGIVDVHVYDCMHAGALSFATTYWNGEQLGRGPKLKVQGLPLDRFRTEFMGYNWGPPGDLLYYVIGGYRPSSATSLLHDIPVRPESLKDFDLEASIWRVREEFGIAEAEFLPYWRNAEYVTASPEGCEVTLHRHPAGRVLAIVSNLKLEEAEVQLSLNAGKLGLTGTLTARDALGETPVAVEGETLRLRVPAQDFTVLWIEGAAKQPR